MEEEKVAKDKKIDEVFISIPLNEIMEIYNLACSITMPKVRYAPEANGELIMAKEAIFQSITQGYLIVNKVYEWTKKVKEENKGGEEKAELP
jgi:hypothetical protein